MVHVPVDYDNIVLPWWSPMAPCTAPAALTGAI